MKCHAVFEITYPHNGKPTKELVCLKRDYRRALLKCIIKNFKNIENVFPFYDSVDERGNNLYFKDTPQGKFQEHFLFLEWYNHKSIKDFNHLYKYDVNSLKNMLKIQDQLIYPDYNGNWEEKFYCVETWQIQ